MPGRPLLLTGRRLPGVPRACAHACARALHRRPAGISLFPSCPCLCRCSQRLYACMQRACRSSLSGSAGAYNSPPCDSQPCLLWRTAVPFRTEPFRAVPCHVVRLRRFRPAGPDNDAQRAGQDHAGQDVRGARGAQRKHRALHQRGGGGVGAAVPEVRAAAGLFWGGRGGGRGRKELRPRSGPDASNGVPSSMLLRRMAAC